MVLKVKIILITIIKEINKLNNETIIMKTQENKLAFNKSSLVELNYDQLQDINGGSTPLTITLISPVFFTR